MGAQRAVRDRLRAREYVVTDRLAARKLGGNDAIGE